MLKPVLMSFKFHLGCISNCTWFTSKVLISLVVFQIAPGLLQRFQFSLEGNFTKEELYFTGKQTSVEL